MTESVQLSSDSVIKSESPLFKATENTVTYNIEGLLGFKEFNNRPDIFTEVAILFLKVIINNNSSCYKNNNYRKQ